MECQWKFLHICIARPATARPSLSHVCSMGLKSGIYTGQSICTYSLCLWCVIYDIGTLRTREWTHYQQVLMQTVRPSDPEPVPDRLLPHHNISSSPLVETLDILILWLIGWLVVDAWIARSHTSYSMVRHVCCELQFTSSPSSEWSSIDIWLNLRGWSLPECFSSSLGSFTSTLNVRVEGTSTLRDMRATRGTPPNVEEQRN